MSMKIDGRSFDSLLSAAPFRELHQRVIEAPIADVWPHCLNVTTREVRLMGPLMELRHLPSRLTGRHAPSLSAPDASPGSLLDGFTSAGFIVLRRDKEPRDGRASVVFGAAGRFWSIRGNGPVGFDDPDAFLAFDEPDYAKTVARLEAIDLGNGTTRVETETLVNGNDAVSNRKFAPYWALIRLPSGAIRRSWLAAIDRRVKR